MFELPLPLFEKILGARLVPPISQTFLIEVLALLGGE